MIVIIRALAYSGAGARLGSEIGETNFDTEYYYFPNIMMDGVGIT